MSPFGLKSFEPHIGGSSLDDASSIKLFLKLGEGSKFFHHMICELALPGIAWQINSRDIGSDHRSRMLFVVLYPTRLPMRAAKFLESVSMTMEILA